MEINLLILSNDPVARAGLEAIVDQDEEVSLISRSALGDDDSRCPEKAGPQPHVIILGEPSSKRSIFDDVQNIIRKYRHQGPVPRIVVVSQNDDDDRIVAALRVGVNGYLARMGSSEELLHSIRLVARGGAAFSPAIAARLSGYFSSMHSRPELAGFEELTDRELEVLTLIAEGVGNQQIARRLFLAEKTVRNYVTRIFAKLDVRDRAAAAVRARDAGLGLDGAQRAPA